MFQKMLITLNKHMNKQIILELIFFLPHKYQKKDFSISNTSIVESQLKIKNFL